MLLRVLLCALLHLLLVLLCCVVLRVLVLLGWDLPRVPQAFSGVSLWPELLLFLLLLLVLLLVLLLLLPLMLAAVAAGEFKTAMPF